MQTLNFLSPEKQVEISMETLEIFAPLAHRLGIEWLRGELEDLTFKYLKPAEYRVISDAIVRKKRERDAYIGEVKELIKQRLEHLSLKAEVFGRAKRLYSIYRKMVQERLNIDQLYDLTAFRVMVNNVKECYEALGYIHDLFKPGVGRFKDYIGTPKPNMNQSLHTTVIGREGIPFEVQIRTWEMHQVAEYGVAAHWKYKQGMENVKLGTEKNFEWVRKLLESQQDADAEEFVRTLKVDLFADEVFVFTPRGDVINLPAGATPIDFAYSIHSAVGNTMTAAKVNGRIVPFTAELRNGDIVEIITSKAAHGPSRDWIKIAKSNEARNKIKQWLKKERREENILQGRSSFEAELRRAGIAMTAISAEDVLPGILKKVAFNSLDEMYAAIGYGGLTSQKAVNRIRDELVRINKLRPERSTNATALSGAPKKAVRSESGIIVEGLGNCMVKFSHCCTPVPGDPVIGFITRGYGVSVHRLDCPNAAPDRRKPEEDGRWVNVSWVPADRETYQTTLELDARNRDGLIVDVATALNAQKIRVNSLSARGRADGSAVVNLSFDVENLEQLKLIMSRLNQIPGILQVKRAGEP
jgi:GTP pyrophosphokinase